MPSPYLLDRPQIDYIMTVLGQTLLPIVATLCILVYYTVKRRAMIEEARTKLPQKLSRTVLNMIAEARHRVSSLRRQLSHHQESNDGATGASAETLETGVEMQSQQGSGGAAEDGFEIDEETSEKIDEFRSECMGYFLFITYLVFPSTSSAIFRMYSCNEEFDDGKAWLKADYSISCIQTRYQIMACEFVLPSCDFALVDEG